jgi:hypothetical protein
MLEIRVRRVSVRIPSSKALGVVMVTNEIIS